MHWWKKVRQTWSSKLDDNTYKWNWIPRPAQELGCRCWVKLGSIEFVASMGWELGCPHAGWCHSRAQSRSTGTPSSGNLDCMKTSRRSKLGACPWTSRYCETLSASASGRVLPNSTRSGSLFWIACAKPAKRFNQKWTWMHYWKNAWMTDAENMKTHIDVLVRLLVCLCVWTHYTMCGGALQLLSAVDWSDLTNIK